MPFIVAFGVIALAISVLIVVNVVGGAVVAGTTRIGVLKSVGFTPAQVVACYVLLVAVPAVTGAAAGLVVGNLLAVPLYRQNAQVYQVGVLGVPFWVDIVVPLAVIALTVLAAVGPASRAGLHVRGAGDRDRPRAEAAARVLRAADAREADVGAPPGYPRVRRARRQAGPDPGHAGRRAVRRGGGHLRRRARDLAEPRLQRHLRRPRVSRCGSCRRPRAARRPPPGGGSVHITIGPHFHGLGALTAAQQDAISLGDRRAPLARSTT